MDINEDKNNIRDILDTNRSGYFTFENIDEKLLPIYKNQEKINQLIITGSESGILLDDNLEDISTFTGALSTSIGQISSMSFDANLLSTPLSYDFINNPLISGVNIAADNILSLQNDFINNFNISTPATFNMNETLDYIDVWKPEVKFNNLALDTLQNSYVFPTIKDKEGENSEKIKLLEEEIEKIKNSENKIIEEVVSEKLEILLNTLDNDLFKMYRGAIAVIINPNDDSLAQSAESMTRLLEKISYILSPKYILKNKKEDDIKEMLAIYLKITYVNVSDIHNYIIDQQHYFYETFSQIRHRNKDIYKKYNDDPLLYKSLLLQAQGFLYHLITN